MTIIAILVAGAITGAIAFNGQQAYAPRNCGGCVISQFTQATHELERNVITAVSEGNPDEVGEDIETFALFMRSLPLPPDPTIDALIANYEDGVMRIFAHPPPTGDKHAQHDQIKEFKQLTKEFERQMFQQILQQLTQGGG